MAIRASGAGRKKNVVPIASKRVIQIHPLAGLLSPVAEEVWNKNAKILSERGMFEPEHHLMLILYCNAWHYIVEDESSIAEKAKTMTASRGLAGEGGSGGEKTNPVFAAKIFLSANLFAQAQCLGLIRSVHCEAAQAARAMNTMNLTDFKFFLRSSAANIQMESKVQARR